MKRLVASLLALVWLGFGCHLLSEASRGDDPLDRDENWSSDDGQKGQADAEQLNRMEPERNGVQAEPPPESRTRVAAAPRTEPAAEADPAPEDSEPVPPPPARAKRRARKAPETANAQADDMELVSLTDGRTGKKAPRVEPAPKSATPLLEDPPAEGDDGGWQSEPSPIGRETGPNEFQARPAKPGEGSAPRTAAPPRAEPAPRVEVAPREEVAPRPEPATADPAAQPELRETKTTDEEAPDVLIEIRGGVGIVRGGRALPSGGLGLAWNLGKFLGWPGLYLKADVDTFIDERPLGTEGVLLDGGLGLLGRFGLGPVNLLVNLEFAVRHMIINQEGSSTSGDDPVLGYGPVFMAGLDLPVSSYMYLSLMGGGRFMKDPLLEKFEFAGVVTGAVGYSF